MEYCNLDPEPEPESDADLTRGWPKYGIITAEGASFAHHKSLPYVLKTMFFCIRASEKVIQSAIRVIECFYYEDEISSVKITALRCLLRVQAEISTNSYTFNFVYNVCSFVFIIGYKLVVVGQMRRRLRSFVILAGEVLSSPILFESIEGFILIAKALAFTVAVMFLH